MKTLSIFCWLFFVLVFNLRAESQIGELCSSDYDCASFCCNNGTCQIHDPSGKEKQLCNKAPGESCISSDFCAKVSVKSCKVVSNKADNETGEVTCSLQCNNKVESGDCINGICTAPEEFMPDFDPENPDCSLAE